MGCKPPDALNPFDLGCKRMEKRVGMVRENQREEFIWDDDALGISATLINERITLWLVDGNDQKQSNSKELA